MVQRFAVIMHSHITKTPQYLKEAVIIVRITGI
jgi:hypothetical protein